MKTINVYYSDFNCIDGLKEVMTICMNRNFKLFTVIRFCNNFIEVEFEKDSNSPYFLAEHYSKTNLILIS